HVLLDEVADGGYDLFLDVRQFRNDHRSSSVPAFSMPERPRTADATLRTRQDLTSGTSHRRVARPRARWAARCRPPWCTRLSRASGNRARRSSRSLRTTRPDMLTALNAL